MSQQSQALATRPPQGAQLDIIALATTEEDRRDAGRAVVLANSGLVPEAMRGNPSAVLTAMWVCDALDIDRTPLNFGQLYTVHGRPGVMTQLQLGLAHRAGFYSKWLTESNNDQEAAIEMGGQQFKFTAAQARTAGLLAGDAYKKYLPDMLRWRAASRAIKGVCPEVVLGLRRAAPQLFQGPDVIDGEVDETQELTRGETGTVTQRETGVSANRTEASANRTTEAPKDGTTSTVVDNGATADPVPPAKAKLELVEAAKAVGLVELAAKALAQQVWTAYKMNGEPVSRSALNLMLVECRQKASAAAANPNPLSCTEDHNHESSVCHVKASAAVSGALVPPDAAAAEEAQGEMFRGEQS
jgi:hypothetical protein